MNKNLTITSQNSKLVLAKSKNLLNITNKLLAKKEEKILAESFMHIPFLMEQGHSAQICTLIISPDGKITRYLYGLDFLPFDLKMAIIEAQKGLAKPTINKVLQYCFNYDPQGQSYTLSVTRVAGTIIMFFAVIIFFGLIISRRRSIKKV